MISKPFFYSIALLFYSLASQPLTAQEMVVGANYELKSKNYGKKKLAKSALELPFFDDFSSDNERPNTLKWTGEDVLINNTYPVNPINIGVATLDAINQSGEMHSISTGTVFQADELCSSPINLAYSTEENIFLSFAYQPQGMGDNPNKNDMLVLEFYAPELDEWENVWQTTGDSVKPFKMVILPVNQDKYLKNGFQFRFRNYASTPASGALLSEYSNCDHWHLDYILLDKNRHAADTVFTDVGLTYSKINLFKTYNAVPWKHFTEGTEGELLINPLEITIGYRNLGYIYPNLTRRFSVQDLSESNSEYSFTGGSVSINSFETTSYTRRFLYDFNFDDSKDSAKYRFTSYLVTDTDPETALFRNNDTISIVKNFYNYYAYDDGSAELGYGISGEGTKSGKVAVKYYSHMKDSLRAIQIFFNKTQEPAGELDYFILKLWDDDNGEPGNLLYQQKGAKPEYDGLNKFVSYQLDSVIALYGAFYIGWEQTTEEFLNVGLDVNNACTDTLFNDASIQILNKNLFYNYTGNWMKSSVAGALMFRPVFEKNKLISSNPTQQIQPTNFKAYPNPVKDYLNFQLSEEIANETPIYIEIYQLNGAKVFFSEFNSSINLSHLQNGIYILRLKSKKNIFTTKKIIIQH